MPTVMSLFFAFSPMETPASVPPVPTAQMKPSTLPCVSFQISAAVVSIWPWRLATLSNWFAQIAPCGALGCKLFGEPPGIFHVVVRVLIGNRGNFDQLGAGKPQHLLLLVGLRLGDDDDRLQPERIADKRKADAGIAGGAFDHGAARLKATGS